MTYRFHYTVFLVMALHKMAEILTGLVLQHCHVEMIMCSVIVSDLINMNHSF